MEKTKWGIMGAGLLADDCFAPALLKAKNAELLSVYCRSKDKAQLFGEKYNIPSIHWSKEEFLKNPELDIVYISTPNAHHYEDVIAAANAGKNIFCEKPVALNSEEAIDMKSICDEHNVSLGIAFMFPFHPLSISAREQIQSGKIGKPRIMMANFIFDLPWKEKINPWRFNPSLSGGGVIIEVGCHCINILDHLSGLKIKVISAVADNKRNIPPSESTGVLTLTYEDGSTGIVTVANNIPAGPYGTCFRIYGTEGCLIGKGNLSRNPSGRLSCYNKAGKEEIISLPDVTAYTLYIREIESFSKSIIDRNEYVFNIQYGIEHMKVIDSAYKSIETGQRIFI